jgi:hypothetical protein
MQATGDVRSEGKYGVVDAPAILIIWDMD